MGSKSFDGVRFRSYSNDHQPPHVHGEYGDVEVVIDLLPENGITISSRAQCITPANAKKSDVRKILDTALDYADELHKIWNETHGDKA